MGLLLLLTSCSKEEAEAGEWDNWQQRNEVFFASLADSLSANPTQWQRILNYSLNPSDSYNTDKYVYVKKLEQGSGTDSPAYTDSVRIVYQGRLIPTINYSNGFIFDGTVSGTFSLATAATAKMVISSTVDGFATALQHMHRGDHWRVYIPSSLGYGDDGNNSGSVPGNSVLVFDLQLVDFSHAGEAMPVWSSRKH